MTRGLGCGPWTISNCSSRFLRRGKGNSYGDGETTQFQLTKNYQSGDAVYVRPVKKPVLGTVKAGVQGQELFEAIDWEVDTLTGMITFATPPAENAAVSAGYEFDVPVRFDTNRIATSVASFQAGEVPNVPIVEVRV